MMKHVGAALLVLLVQGAGSATARGEFVVPYADVTVISDLGFFQSADWSPVLATDSVSTMAADPQSEFLQLSWQGGGRPTQGTGAILFEVNVAGSYLLQGEFEVLAGGSTMAKLDSDDGVLAQVGLPDPDTGPLVWTQDVQLRPGTHYILELTGTAGAEPDMASGLLSIALVPEPSSMMLLATGAAAGALALLGRRRARRNAASGRGT